MWVCALATMIVGNFAAIHAIEHQAHAGLQLHRARRLRAGGGHGELRNRLRRRHVLSGGVRRSPTSERSPWSRTSRARANNTSTIDDFAGLAQRQPAMAAMLTIFLLSLIGVPLTGGFFGKFYIFKAALDSHLVWLTVLGLLNSAVAAYYYLRILVVMYFQEPGESVEDLPPVGGALQIAVYASAALTVILGVRPDLILDFATKASLK